MIMLKQDYKKRLVYILLTLGVLFGISVQGCGLVADGDKGIISGEVWRDMNGDTINAHGGGLLFHEGTYYWFGENRPASGFVTEKGINCYSSADLCDWKYEGIALGVSGEEGHDIEKGCIMERPKVIYNEKTGKFVMWFHLELKGMGYEPARAAVAISDSPAGPYRFIRSGRVNPGVYPLNMGTKEQEIGWDFLNIRNGGPRNGIMPLKKDCL
jgi:hypothetical protein